MYFAKLDSNNIVIQVIVADQSFIDSQPGTWVQTDINGISPKNYAGIGHTWNSGINAFVSPKPFPSWVLNNSTGLWGAPVPMPDYSPGYFYRWNESILNWDKVQIPN